MFRSPQSIVEDLQARVQALLDTHIYYRQTDPVVLGIIEDIDKLDVNYEIQANGLRSMIFGITHRTDEAISILENSNASSVHASQTVGILCNSGSNLRAQELYAKYLSPTSGFFTKNVPLGFATGAFRLIAEFARTADKQMGLTNLEGVPMELIQEADAMLAEFGIDDKTVGLLFQEAGAIFSQNQLFYMGAKPDVEVIDIPGVLRNLLVTFQLPVSAEKTSALYLQFIDRLIDNSIDMPFGLQINFASAPTT